MNKLSKLLQEVRQYLAERKLTFKQLMDYAEPRRVARSQTVRGGPLKIETFEDSVFHVFNFKSFPSTTGKRHHGYIKFFKPRSPRPLDELECMVDCTCPDFKYRYAWAVKQRGSSVVGAQSMNRAWNRAPRITNPGSRPGICKHIIRLKDYITGLTSDEAFGQGAPDTSSMMRTLMRYADGRWTDTPDTDQEDRDREAAVQSTRLQRNRGQLPSNAPPPSEPQVEPEGSVEEPEPLPSRDNSTTAPNPSNQPNPMNGFTAPEGGAVPPPRRRRRTELGDSVDRLGMNKYAAEIKLCEELEAAEEVKPSAPELTAGQGDESSEALELLRQIRDFLASMAGVEEPEMEPGEEGAPEDGGAATPPADANSYND